jgi:hypothetical protein
VGCIVRDVYFANVVLQVRITGCPALCDAAFFQQKWCMGHSACDVYFADMVLQVGLVHTCGFCTSLNPNTKLPAGWAVQCVGFPSRCDKHAMWHVTGTWQMGSCRWAGA